MHKQSLHAPSIAKNSHAGFTLASWQVRGIYILVAALTISGVTWLIAHYFLRSASEFGESIHPWEHPAMQLHGAFALLICIISGSLIHWHIQRAHQAKRNRASGWIMVSIMSLLLISGYGLLYLAGEESRFWWSTVHCVTGLSLPLLLILHIVLGRRAVRRHNLYSSQV
jgi:uncharacterized membrane protein